MKTTKPHGLKPGQNYQQTKIRGRQARKKRGKKGAGTWEGREITKQSTCRLISPGQR